MQRYTLLLVIILVLSAACTNIPSLDPTSTPDLRNKTHTATPEEPIAPTVTIPIPSDDSGVVIGRLRAINAETPPSNINVYLGEYMYLTPGPDYMVTFRNQSSPSTISDEYGRFAIANVPPGDYPLVVWTPISSIVISGENGKKELVVHVEAGEVTDLGFIDITLP